MADSLKSQLPLTYLLLLLLLPSAALSSTKSTSDKGIDSSRLTLDGSGISIGQVEQARVGVPNTATPDSAAYINTFTVPEATFLEDVPAVVDTLIDLPNEPGAMPTPKRGHENCPETLP